MWTPDEVREAAEEMMALTCQACAVRYEVRRERRPFHDERYPRETFQIVEIRTCPRCGDVQEKRLQIGH